MPTPSRNAKPKTPGQRMQARRQRLRAQGLRPVQHWVPDIRDPRIRAMIRREATFFARRADSLAIDDWIEAAYDFSEWR